MEKFVLDNSDLEEFSKYMGFSGTDADLFYDVYYQTQPQSVVEELEWDWEG